MVLEREKGAPDVTSTPAIPRMRLDRWLKIARLFKTRTAAKNACEDGKVKLGRKHAKPSSMIAAGDTIVVSRRGKVVFYEVLALSQKSLPAAQAAGLYREKETVERKGNALMKLIEEAEDRFGNWKRKGRPTKREGRLLRKIKGR
jgi:ribosome-associated heat shock protein Hsp15